MIFYGKQTIDKEDIDSVVEVLKSDMLTQGIAVEDFEYNLKSYFGANFVSAVANGTAALHLAGLGLGWKSEDIVITSPITFLASANCIVYTGARPSFVDIDPVTYTIEPNQLEERIKSYQSIGKKVKAVIGVDYAGHPCDWQALREIADKYEVQLVNDNCHALGATYDDDKCYAVKFADVVTQSYHPVKHITTGEGGAVLTNDKIIDEKVKCLRNHGIIKNKEQLDKKNTPWFYEMYELGYNYRITNFQCALGSSQLKKLGQFIQKRRNIAKKYDKTFSKVKNFKKPNIQNNVKHAYHLYPLQIDFKNLSLNKSDVFVKMREAGISLQVHYIPVHLQPYYQKNYGFKQGDFPVSESFYRNEISLPIYPSLPEDSIDLVKNNLLEIIST